LEVQRLRLKLSRAETIDTGVKSIDHCNYYAGGQGGWDDGQLNPELCVWKDLAININGYCAISYNSSDPRSPVLQAFLAAQPPRLRLGGVAITFARATATLGSLTLYIESMFKAWEIETGLQCPAELRQLLEEVRSVIDFSLPIMDEIFAQVPKHTTFDLFALTFNPPIDVEKIILSIRDI
jgi:hypothetical protein